MDGLSIQCTALMVMPTNLACFLPSGVLCPLAMARFVSRKFPGQNWMEDAENNQVVGGDPLLQLIAVDWFKVDRATDGVALHPNCLLKLGRENSTSQPAKKGVGSSTPASQEKSKDTTTPKSSVAVVANGPIGLTSGTASGSGESTVYFSSSDPVLVPSNDSRLATGIVGTLKREAGSHQSLADTYVAPNSENQKLELPLPQRQHVIIPNHIHVMVSERTKLSFGSFDANFGVTSSSTSGPESEKSSTPLSEATQNVEEALEEPATRCVLEL